MGLTLGTIGKWLFEKYGIEFPLILEDSTLSVYPAAVGLLCFLIYSIDMDKIQNKENIIKKYIDSDSKEKEKDNHKSL